MTDNVNLQSTCSSLPLGCTQVQGSVQVQDGDKGNAGARLGQAQD